MMKRGLIVVIVAVAVMIAGAGLTSQVTPEVPTIIQTSDPNGSVFEATPIQAGQFIFWIGFVIVNVVGVGLTIAGLLWLANREVARAKAMPTLEEKRAAEAEGLPEKANA